ncbi:MAG TPA: T9SS type A sorting domain-containing protein [Saprospiraceae bacterium]|nr:T9SS type A sorting domain-containing protein [Saprospiraceae bacterium]
MKRIFLTCICLSGFLFLTAQTRYYVHQLATGANNGQSWQDAYTDLQSALQMAQSGDELWIAAGIYFPTSGADQTISFEPKSGVKLYGGFSGTETSLSQRDWTSYPTVLSGDIGVAGDSLDNSYTILYLDNPDSLTIIDGLIFRYGNAGYSTNDQLPVSRFRSGGALYIQSNMESYALIQNCRFEYNTARNNGGAVYVNGAGSFDAAPTFQNCIFAHNTAEFDGGALARIGNSDIERPDFTGCTFMKNKAGRYGGGLYYQDAFVDSWVDVSDCKFIQNESINLGAGAFLRIGRTGDGSRVRINNCVFDENQKNAQLAFFVHSGQYTEVIYIQKCVFFQKDDHDIYYDVLGTDSSSIWIEDCRFEGQNSNYSLLAGGVIDKLYMNRDTIKNYLNHGAIQSYGNLITEINNSILHNINRVIFTKSKFNQISNCVIAGSQFSMGIANFGLLPNNGTSQNPILFKSCNFINNQCNGLVWGLDQSNPPKQSKFENCLFYNNPVSYTNVGSPFMVNTLEYCRFDTNSICETNNVFHTNICGPGNVFGIDPLFRDTANNDYSLLPCSPLLNAGSNAAAAGILTDIAGNPRIQEGTVDIGAYESPGFTLAAAPMVAPACAGTSGGSISLQPVNGCEPYTYNWLPNAGTGAELNELPPGAYQLTLTDASGRQITDTILVPEAPRPDLNLLATDVNCGNPAGGSLTAVVNSGTGPFSYQWLPAAADTAVLKKLPAGAYTLTLTDVNGCQDSATANIQLIGAITLAVDGQPIPCYGQTGWLSATPANGAPPFSWQWSGWSGTDSLAQPLTPGNYAVTVADAYGCTASFTYPPLTQPDSLYLGTGNTPQTQSNPPNGTALVTTISGGTFPFDYYWTTMEETQAITGLPAGTYTVTVSDKNGCTATAEVVVQLMVSTEESGQQALLLYPNPATDWVQLLLPAGQWQWALTDAGGKQLRSGVCESEQARLELSGLASGAYILRAWNGQQTWVGRVVKR